MSDPGRTGDELFTVELLLERMAVKSDWPVRERNVGFEEKMRRMKERKFTPGYRPDLPREELEALAAQPAMVTHFTASGGNDRPLRDLAALGFFPALEDINVTGCDVGDLSPLARLTGLKSFTMMENPELLGAHALDFAQLGTQPALERVWLVVHQPWPEVRALGSWPALRELHFHGNLLSLAEVESLPAVEMLQAKAGGLTSTPLRDLRTFPALPKVKRMELHKTASLAGIERFGSLVNLELGGMFTDLSPLAGLTNVTFLKLEGEQFSDLRPLAQMPKLRELVLLRERPLDLSPLAEAPHLRRVQFERCAFMRMEVAALNAGLPPEADDFLAPEPRPLGPLRFYVKGKAHEAAQAHFMKRSRELVEARENFYAGDAALNQAEARTFLGALHAEMTRLLGRGWGLVPFSQATTAGGTFFNLKRYQDTTRLREIVQLLRERSARSRFPWHFTLMVEPHGNMSYELEELQELEEKAKEPEGHWLAKYVEPESVLEESAEEAQRYREKYELLEREHLYELQQQQGMTEAKLPPIAEDEDEDDEEDMEAEDEEELRSEPATEDDDQEGGVAIAPPPPAPPDAEGLSDSLRFVLEVYEDCMLVNETLADRARYTLGEAPVEWTPDA